MPLMDLIREWKRGKRRAAGMFPVSSLAIGRWSFHSAKIKDARKKQNPKHFFYTASCINSIQELLISAIRVYLKYSFSKALSNPC